MSFKPQNLLLFAYRINDNSVKKSYADPVMYKLNFDNLLFTNKW